MEHAERIGHAHERHPAGRVEYHRDVESVAFFSDAVFAIAMTLLIMEHLDGGALLITLLFLMSVAFLPFPTLLLNNDFGPVAVIF